MLPFSPLQQIFSCCYFKYSRYQELLISLIQVILSRKFFCMRASLLQIFAQYHRKRCQVVPQVSGCLETDLQTQDCRLSSMLTKPYATSEHQKCTAKALVDSELSLVTEQLGKKFLPHNILQQEPNLNEKTCSGTEGQCSFGMVYCRIHFADISLQDSSRAMLQQDWSVNEVFHNSIRCL